MITVAGHPNKKHRKFIKPKISQLNGEYSHTNAHTPFHKIIAGVQNGLIYHKKSISSSCNTLYANLIQQYITYNLFFETSSRHSFKLHQQQKITRQKHEYGMAMWKKQQQQKQAKHFHK